MSAFGPGDAMDLAELHAAAQELSRQAYALTERVYQAVKDQELVPEEWKRRLLLDTAALRPVVERASDDAANDETKDPMAAIVRAAAVMSTTAARAYPICHDVMQQRLLDNVDACDPRLGTVAHHAEAMLMEAGVFPAVKQARNPHAKH